MITKPNKDLTEALQRYCTQRNITQDSIPFEVDGAIVTLPSFRQGDKRVVLTSMSTKSSIAENASALKLSLSSTQLPTDDYEIMFISDSNKLPAKKTVIERGVSVLPLHQGLLSMMGFPQSWDSQQQVLLTKTLQPVVLGAEPKPATLYARRQDGSCIEAHVLLGDKLSKWLTKPEPATYLKAEAGKGKTISLASAVYSKLNSMNCPVPVFIPLRVLHRGRGISWEELCAAIGVLGDASENLRAAVHAGLASLVLDGLDEIAGRYDPTIVSGVLAVIQGSVASGHSCIILSGRTTEATLLQPSFAEVFSLDLPDENEPAFRDYAMRVAKAITPLWPKLMKRVPDLPAPTHDMNDVAPTSQELEVIVEWLQIVFSDLGKERSLFFVQSLSCLGRTLQLAGNKALVIRQGSKLVQYQQVSLFDTAVLASTLACIREQDKIEDLAKSNFTPERQLDLLMFYSVMSSSSSSILNQLPRPNELAQKVFNIDPVNQNEEFTAVLRQLQKHALLFVSGGEGLRAGDWRPDFLSDWTRSTLLCRAWLRRVEMGEVVIQSTLSRAIAEAEHARILFQICFPELVSLGRLPSLKELVSCLQTGIDNQSPEASANYWALRAGLDPKNDVPLSQKSQGLVPFADLTEITFEGLALDQSFSGTLAILVGAEFDSCSLVGCRFDQSDFANTMFSGCTLNGVVFMNCSGPFLFESCSFRDCRFIDSNSTNSPAYSFLDCTFEGGCKIQQDQFAYRGTYGPIAIFENCICAEKAQEMFSGECLGMSVASIVGLAQHSEKPSEPVDVACLRSLLKPFFPRRSGTAKDIQVRGYIRTSAIRRGRFPEGSPPASELIQMLFSLGFSDGGREGRIHAPWSPVAGGSPDAIVFRNELTAFMQQGKQGDSVKELLDRIGKRLS